MTKHYRSGPQGSWEQPRQQYSAPQQSPHRPPLAPVGARGPQQVRGATRPQPSPRQPSQPPPLTAPTTGLSISSAAPPERSLRACADGDSGSVEGAASTGRSGQQAQDADVPTDTPESHQDAAHRELQHDNVEAAQVHALLAVGAAIERLARAVEDSRKTVMT
jgi:hypothetical protein